MSQSDVVRTVTRLAPSETSRIVTFTLSDDTPDRMRDTIDPKGWKLDNYRKNPVVLWGHDQSSPPIGRASNVRVSKGQLVADIEFASADESAFADTIYKLVKGGFIHAGSVGFVPVRWEFKDDGGIAFHEQELLEYSIVTVPANPAALVQARSMGIDTAPLVRMLRERPSVEVLDVNTPAEDVGGKKSLSAFRNRQRAIASQLRIASV